MLSLSRDTSSSNMLIGLRSSQEKWNLRSNLPWSLMTTLPSSTRDSRNKLPLTPLMSPCSVLLPTLSFLASLTLLLRFSRTFTDLSFTVKEGHPGSLAPHPVNPPTRYSLTIPFTPFKREWTLQTNQT